MKYILWILLATSAAQAHVHQIFDIQITPALKSLVARDLIQATSPAQHRYRFQLHKNLSVKCLSPDDTIADLYESPSERFREYELVLGPDHEALIEYAGVIYDPVVDNESSGLISPEGAVLFGSSYWAPVFSEFTTYSIHTASLPADWVLASPAELNLPQPEIYLIAGPFKKYALETSPTPFYVYLRGEDPALAQSLLSPLPAFLDRYNKLIGPFPYSSFSVIENFWETGYGMPAFTLLGPGVVRLPYILNTSLPHELLHNWWGNSVHVDYARGNWSEGLTTYMSDYGLLANASLKKDYRLHVLMNYQDYTRSAGDFPLRKFTGRHNASTQAIGYGKGLMLYHMLEQYLSEETFNQGLQMFYQNYRSQAVSFEELQGTFENITRAPLKTFFSQWLDRAGAPYLKIKDFKITKDGSKGTLTLEQLDPVTQNSLWDPYQLRLPVQWTFNNGTVEKLVLNMTQSIQSFSLTFSSPIKKFEVDPDFDVFRWLDREERPVSLSTVFGAAQIWVTSSDIAIKDAYVKIWKGSTEGDVIATSDDILKNLPATGAIVMIGDSPAYEAFMKTVLKGQDFSLTTDEITILGKSYPRARMSTMLAGTVHQGDLSVLWIRSPKNIESFAPRLLHYGKFGVLVFEEKTNLLKASWPVISSPLIVNIP
ncbi:MAG: M1 family peptidase [Bdellovibrionaceae bacterium]|nr:M1 family peptidase [Pseudobdellovibrionaceae bacterium]